MPEQHQEKGTPREGLPWSFILDPAANVRALGDVQRRGLLAARELVDRVVSTIDPSGAPPSGAPSNGAPSSGAASTGSEQNPPLGDLMQAWWELAARVLTAVPATYPSTSERMVPSEGSITVDLTSEGRPSPWRLQADASGEFLVPAELWLRNPSSHPMGPVRVSVGDLRASDGTALGSACLRFDPSAAVELPARSARGVILTLSLDEPLEPGTYRGVIQADGAPNLWVTLEIAVKSEPP
jgi:hypothetical protein